MKPRFLAILCCFFIATYGFGQLKVLSTGNATIGPTSTWADFNLNITGSGTYGSEGILSFGDNSSSVFNVLIGEYGTGDTDQLLLHGDNGIQLSTSESLSPKMFISGSGNIGIGITPAVKLHINGSIRGDQTSGALKISTSSGYTTIGPYNTAFSHIYTDRSDFYINKGIRVETGLIGSYNEDLLLRTGPYSRVYIKYSSGDVGIGEYDPSYKLDVNGDIATYGVLRISSDERLKKDIVDIRAQQVDNLYNLQAKTYFKDNSPLAASNEGTAIEGDTISDSFTEIDTTLKIGFIAQDLMEYFPNLVKQDNKGFYSIDYISLIPVLVEALKDQQKRIAELESNILYKKAAYDLQSNSSSSLEPYPVISTGATLQQNIPNPFNERTIIKYSIPLIKSYALINLYDLQGSQIKSYSLTQTGEGEIIIPGSELNPGLYIYNLIIDGIEVASKRMVLTE